MSAKWLILQATIVAGIELMGVSREGTSRHFSMMNKVSAVEVSKEVRQMKILLPLFHNEKETLSQR